HYATALQQDEVPIAHYLTKGCKLGFDPNPYFDSDWYRKQYRTEIGAEEPFAHFIRKGDTLGFSPGPQFDSSWYRWRHSDLAESGIPS
ncbi:hypothetical protein JEG46_08295, partial [Anoxybacillus sp. LAT_26]|uniref:hypothetical protein n=1 Tax=Anoxybacillus sp. LAT_26 TaxID=2862719 RepID=UPI001EECC6B2